jgi:hypothetical protein
MATMLPDIKCRMTNVILYEFHKVQEVNGLTERITNRTPTEWIVSQ